MIFKNCTSERGKKFIQTNKKQKNTFIVCRSLGTKKQKYHSEHGCLQCWYTATRIIWIYYKQSNVIIPTYSAYSSFDTCCFELEWFITIDFILIVASMFVVVHRCLDFRWTICIFFLFYDLNLWYFLQCHHLPLWVFDYPDCDALQYLIPAVLQWFIREHSVKFWFTSTCTSICTSLF
jgi:hypothetical protein